MRLTRGTSVLAVAGLLALGCQTVGAQGKREDYDRAQQFLPGNLRHHIYVADVNAHWIGKTSRFWYRKSSPKGVEFLLVDPSQGATKPAFDHASLAGVLSKQTKHNYSATELPFEAIEFVKDGKSIEFHIDNAAWQCDLASYECKSSKEAGSGEFEMTSPNKEWIAYVKDYNLVARYVPTGETIQLTRDGEAGWDYATPILSLRPMVEQRTQEAKQQPAVFWSPDSSRLVTYRMDTRNAGRFTNLQFVPADQLRPRAFNVVYPLPGEALPVAQPIIFDMPSGKRIEIKTPPLQMKFQGGPEFEWLPDGKSFFYDDGARGEKSIEVRIVDAETGDQKIAIREESEKYVDPGESFFRILQESGELIWASERDGWNHLYLYNQKTHKLENQITKGPWVVRQIVDVDEKARRVYFLGNGREKEDDPYLTHLYGLGFDGQNLASLTPENANHTVSVSPDHAYFVDNASRADLPGESVLRSLKDGSKIHVLEQTAAGEIVKMGWKAPEPFHGKAKDGSTDTYGLIWRPTNFDSAKKYPIVELVYTGPQGFFVPKTFSAGLRVGQQAIAELGFIAVMVDGRGTTGRSRAFHEYSYHNLGGSFEDHVEMIKQMAAKYPQIDISRVGIYGTSAGGYGAAHAILSFPDFYKVCVSISGDHDARLDKAWWNELYQGYPVGSDYAEQSNVAMAGSLQGNLLLMHGDIDDNVHVVETMRFADALMKANKNFDMLIVPNMYHGEGGNTYLIRRRWDYFVQHLLDATPPPNFEVHEDKEPTPPARHHR
jgi:dipeptidyl-peptidase-4